MYRPFFSGSLSHCWRRRRCRCPLWWRRRRPRLLRTIIATNWQHSNNNNNNKEDMTRRQRLLNGPSAWSTLCVSRYNDLRFYIDFSSPPFYAFHVAGGREYHTRTQTYFAIDNKFLRHTCHTHTCLYIYNTNNLLWFIGSTNYDTFSLASRHASRLKCECRKNEEAVPLAVSRRRK